MARAPRDEFGTIIADPKPKPTPVEDPSVTEAKAAIAEARAAAAASAAAAGGAIVDGKYTPPAKPTPVVAIPTGGRTVFDIVDNNDGTKTIVYSNGDKEIIGNKTVTEPTKPTTNIDVMKAQLKGLGFSSGVVDASTGFLSSLLAEGLDYDNATDIFLNNQEYTLKNGTKMKSPFYAEYGYLNEVLASPKPPSELYNAVEGYKIVQQRFNLDKKFTTPEYLKELVKNNVDVQTFSERANIARLAAINADPAKVQALIRLGNIKDATGLTDFYLDPKIGQEVMQQNVNTAAFVTEAVRRAQSGIAIDTDYARKIGAELTAKGLTEAQVTGVAAQGYEAIGQQLNPLVKLEQIYGQRTGMGSMPESQLRADLQKQLEAEQFGGTASELLRRRVEEEQLAFQRKSGTIGANRMSGGSLGTKSTAGLL
jgi:hypothetical protein